MESAPRTKGGTLQAGSTNLGKLCEVGCRGGRITHGILIVPALRKFKLKLGVEPKTVVGEMGGKARGARLGESTTENCQRGVRRGCQKRGRQGVYAHAVW